jgi:hypothetical protein
MPFFNSLQEIAWVLGGQLPGFRIDLRFQRRFVICQIFSPIQLGQLFSQRADLLVSLLELVLHTFVQIRWVFSFCNLAAVVWSRTRCHLRCCRHVEKSARGDRAR